MIKPITLSGMRPTGELQLGNYLGALQNFVKLQASHEAFFMVADLHSITEDFEPKNKEQQILSLTAAYLAAGVDPNKSTIFLQSFVPEHLELAWVFASITPVGEMERMTQYKDLKLKHGERASAGIFNYPLLMASDILLYKPEVVPVGDDQKQHVELTSTIVKKFNRKFGETFPVPKFTPTKVPRLKSLVDPTRKMSKSEPAGCLFLADDSETISKKMKRAVTATSGGGKNPGVENLFLIMEEFSKPETVKQFKQAEKDGTIRYSDLKEQIANDVAEGLKEYRENYTQLIQKPKQLMDILAEGSKKARAVAARTMGEVKEKIGLPVSK